MHVHQCHTNSPFVTQIYLKHQTVSSLGENTNLLQLLNVPGQTDLFAIDTILRGVTWEKNRNIKQETVKTVYGFTKL